MCQIERSRLFEMLSCGCPFKGDARVKAICEIQNYTNQELANVPESSLHDRKLLELICSAMEHYLVGYKARPIFKHQLKLKLELWLRAIGDAYRLSDAINVDSWPRYVTKDMGIELVKALHEQAPGTTKRDLCTKLGASSKTIQNGLRKLDPKLNEADHPIDTVPYRIGGHEMHVDISMSPIPESHGDRRYYTPNTLHPLVMQLNISQTASMLMALQGAYDRGEYGIYCEDVALDIWCQLSDYCKNRIKLIFTKNNPAFGIFLECLDEMLESGHYPTFRTELMMAEGAPYDIQLDYAVKTEHLCDLVLNIDGTAISLEKIRVFKNDRHTWHCILPKEEPSCESKIIFTVDHVKAINLL